MALKDNLKIRSKAIHTDIARQLLYDHIDVIRNRADEVVVGGVESLKYRVNLYGLYYHLNIDQQYWNITSLINKFDHTTDINELTTVLVPNKAQIDTLIKSITSSERLSYT